MSKPHRGVSCPNLASPSARLTVCELEHWLAPSVTDGGIYVVGSDIGVPNQVAVCDPEGNAVFQVQPYEPDFTGGVRVAFGDVTADGVSDVVTIPGPGMAATVKVYDGSTCDLAGELLAFEETFLGGSLPAD